MPAITAPQARVNYMASRVGRLAYSQLGDRLNPDQTGHTDCSGLVYADLRDVSGIILGTYTDTQAVQGSEVFGTSLNSVSEALQLLQPGDRIYFQWTSHSGGPWWDHVEMYAGGGQTVGHGGDPYIREHMSE